MVLAAVTRALNEFVARWQQKRLLDPFGKLEWDEGYDYKKERERADTPSPSAPNSLRA